MQESTTQAVEPSSDTLPGGTLLRELRRLLLATRPQFLTASALPVLAGTAWAAGAGVGVSAPLFALALVATLLVHAACNVLNDVADDHNGADRANEQRLYPFTGGSRFIPNGVLSVAAMTRWGLVLLGAGVAAGVALVALRGSGVIWFGLAGVMLGLAYSAPPIALVSRGLGEFVIAVAFGWVPVVGAAWLQGATISPELNLLSVPVGLWVASILLVNEVPDAAADGTVGKNTLVVRVGVARTARVYIGMHVVALAAVLWLGVTGAMHPAVMLWAIPALPLAWRVSRAVRAYASDDRWALAVGIRTNLMLQAVGSLWLTGFAWLS